MAVIQARFLVVVCVCVRARAHVRVRVRMLTGCVRALECVLCACVGCWVGWGYEWLSGQTGPELRGERLTQSKSNTAEPTRIEPRLGWSCCREVGTQTKQTQPESNGAPLYFLQVGAQTETELKEKKPTGPENQNRSPTQNRTAPLSFSCRWAPRPRLS